MDVPAVQEDWDLSATGLKIRDPNLPYERFEDLCAALGGMSTAVKFAIGDAIVQGEMLYGQRAFQAFELLNLSEAGMMEYVRVAQAMPKSIRRKGVSWSHHRALIAETKKGKDEHGLPVYDRDAQRTWLKRCKEENISHHQLRDMLRNGAPPKQATICRCCGRFLD